MLSSIFNLMGMPSDSMLMLVVCTWYLIVLVLGAVLVGYFLLHPLASFM